MEAFRKWWDNLLYCNNEKYKLVSEVAYRTALNEVLRKLETTDDMSRLEVVDWIEKELANE